MITKEARIAQLAHWETPPTLYYNVVAIENGDIIGPPVVSGEAIPFDATRLSGLGLASFGAVTAAIFLSQMNADADARGYLS